MQIRACSNQTKLWFSTIIPSVLKSIVDETELNSGDEDDSKDGNEDDNEANDNDNGTP